MKSKLKSCETPLTGILTLVKHSKIIKALLTSVGDISEEFLIGVNQTGEAAKLFKNSTNIQKNRNPSKHVG
jgi:hypothetical protein